MRSALALTIGVLAACLAISGGTAADPAVPHGFPGIVPAFLTAARKPAVEDRRWLERARSLGTGAPSWARAMYRRSLLVLRALTDPVSGAVVAGPRPGWAYVWPRDAGAAAIAFAGAGYAGEARRVVRFLTSLDLDAAARFQRDGRSVEGRGPQGDAAGWVAAAARAAGIRPATDTELGTTPASSPHLGSDAGAWRERADYQERGAGDYLGNAIASGASLRAFVTEPGLVRVAGDRDSGLDTAAAWAVRPFPRPALHPAVRRTLLNLVASRGSRFGLVPSEDWNGGDDPWTAPTAWCAWSLATLWRIDRRAGRGYEATADRRAALSLMADLRRDSTRRGLLPERVDAGTGAPASTTPLAWSHAFAILAIRELWPEARR